MPSMFSRTVSGSMGERYFIKPALCLDFDGTIRMPKNQHAVFIRDEDDIKLIPGIEEAIWRYKDKGFLILGVTNQGGVAHGFKTPMGNMREIDATLKLFNRNPFDMVKTCLHMENGTVEPYCHRSLVRKPYTGMLALMEVELYSRQIIVDWDNSVFVGDRTEDLQCAGNAGIKFIHAKEFLEPHPITVIFSGEFKEQAPVVPIETASQEVSEFDLELQKLSDLYEGTQTLLNQLPAGSGPFCDPAYLEVFNKLRDLRDFAAVTLQKLYSKYYPGTPKGK